MDIHSFFSDKEYTAKQKVLKLSETISDRPEITDALIEYASEGKNSEKAITLEALEYVSKENPASIKAETFNFVTNQLNSNASNIKWEAAKVIGNTAHKHSEKLDEIIPILFVNAQDESTVVRWSVAYALSEIIKLRLPLNEDLLPQVTKIIEKEEKNSIRKIYQKALKQIKE